MRFKESMNRIFIRLVPKVLGAVDLGEYRPTTCPNVLFKVISKVITNWWKIIVPKLISDTLNNSYARKMNTKGDIASSWDGYRLFFRGNYMESLFVSGPKGI